LLANRVGALCSAARRLASGAGISAFTYPVGPDGRDPNCQSAVAGLRVNQQAMMKVARDAEMTGLPPRPRQCRGSPTPARCCTGVKKPARAVQGRADGARAVCLRRGVLTANR
jgi:hypothetical protein